MNRALRVGIDIGGVISRYPDEMKELIRVLDQGGAIVYIVTDMNPKDAHAALTENRIPIEYIENVISCDWSNDGDMCKTKAANDFSLDILIDDRPDYVANGDFIGFCLSPRPNKPYYDPSWVNKSTPSKCVPPEEYEEFQRWKAERNG